MLFRSPTLTPVAGAPVNFSSGPAPAAPIATINTTPNAAPTNVSWVYGVNSNAIATDPYTFSGSATGTGNTAGSPIRTTPITTSASVARGEFPTVVNPSATNASSTNVELTWNITNNGCAAVNSVTITAPGAWGAVTETYSLVSLSAASAIETWGASGTNPYTFTAPNAASQLPQTFSGDFSLVFSTTPTNVGVSGFTIRVTDALGAFTDIPINVMVNPYLAGGLNNAQNKIWREEFR